MSDVERTDRTVIQWRYVMAMVGVVAAVALLFAWTTPSRQAYEQRLAQRRTTLDWASVHDDRARPGTVRWLLSGKARPGCWPQRQLEQRFNLTLNAQMVASAETFQVKLPMQLAAGDVPDVFNPGSAAMLRVYARHGFLMPLPRSLLLEHAPHVVSLVNRHAPEAWAMTTQDDVNYALPSIWYDGLYPRTGLWRADWLENVGIQQVPQTLEQMEDALRRFRNDDPDGNGAQDTYGMSGDLMAYYTTFTEVFGAFGVLPFDWMEHDGRIVWGGIQPQAREALGLLRRWYQEGLIHPDFVTDRWHAEVKSKLFSGRIGYHNYMASYEALDESNPGSVVSMMRELQPQARLVPGPPPLGPGGRRGMRVWGAANAPLLVFGSHMAHRPQDVIRILRLLDESIADPDLYIEMRLGRQGTHWRWMSPSAGPGAGVVPLPPFDDPTVREREGLLPPMFLAGGAVFTPVGGGPEHFLSHMPPDLVAFRAAHRKVDWGMRDVFGSPQNVPGTQSLISSLVQLQQTAYARMIRGSESPDAFDEFVRQWHEQGGDQCLALAAAYWQKHQQVLAEVGAR